MRKSHEAREKLLRLGIFRQVEVLIDTCQGMYCLINPQLSPHTRVGIRIPVMYVFPCATGWRFLVYRTYSYTFIYF